MTLPETIVNKQEPKERSEPTNEELDQIDKEIAAGELDDSWIEDVIDEAESEGLTIQQYLDLLASDRDETERRSNDLYPERFSSGPKTSRVHKDTDPVQDWLARERQQ